MKTPWPLAILLGLTGGGIIGVGASIPLTFSLLHISLDLGYLLFSAMVMIAVSFLFFALYFRYEMIELSLLISLLIGMVGGLILFQLMINRKNVPYAAIMSLEILPSFAVAFYWKLARRQAIQTVTSISQG